MCKFERINEHHQRETIILGTARQILSLEKNMRKRNFYPTYVEKAKVNSKKLYGIVYLENGKTWETSFYVCSSDDILRMLTEEIGWERIV